MNCLFLLAALTVFENGTSRCDIVLPAQSTMVERYAADELKYHLEKMSGAVFSIVAEPEAKTERAHLYVGATRAADAAGVTAAGFAPDERQGVCDGRAVYFRGFDRDGAAVGNGWSATCHGTLYAVYDFLADRLGVRWIWPGETGEVIPKRASLVLDGFRDRRREPLVARTWRMHKPDFSRFAGWTSVEAAKRFYEA